MISISYQWVKYHRLRSRTISLVFNKLHQERQKNNIIEISTSDLIRKRSKEGKRIIQTSPERGSGKEGDSNRIESHIYIYIKKGKIWSESRRRYLGKGGALRPDAAVLADNGSGRQMLAVDVAHQMIVDVRLPRHLLLLLFLLRVLF